MAEGAGDADSRDATLFVEGRLQADDGIALKEVSGATAAEGVTEQKGEQVQPLHVHLEAEAQGFERLDLLLDDLVQAGGVGPEYLVPEGVIPENLLALALEIVADGGLRKLATSCRSQRQVDHPYHQP